MSQDNLDATAAAVTAPPETTLPDTSIAAATEKTGNAVNTAQVPPKAETDKPVPGADTAAKPAPAHKAPEAPAEKPFSVDVLSTCTARFDRLGWDLFLRYREDLAAIQSKRIKVKLTARTEAGAQDIAQVLEAADIPAVKRKGADIEVITTFAGLQTVIRHPQAHMAIVRLAEAA